MFTDPDDPPSRAGLQPHQLWVWLQGANPPHWELRGTGCVVTTWIHGEYDEAFAAGVGVRGRCDTCGAACDDQGCIGDRDHDVAQR